MIDGHVHFRDWSQSDRETIAHGLAVAGRCGIFRVFDMPNTDPPLVRRSEIIRRLEAARPASAETGVCYHVFAGLAQDASEIGEAVDAYSRFFPYVVGLKLYAGSSTGSLAVTGRDAQRGVFAELARLDYSGVVAVHCEKEGLFKPDVKGNGCVSWNAFRPPEAEAGSIRDILEIVGETGFRGRVHIAHLSTAVGLDVVREFRAKGVSVSFGVTPHHALLDVGSCPKELDAKGFMRVNPPLRNPDDRAAMFSALLSGEADSIESDHAPHTLAGKEKGMSGLPGLTGYVRLVKALRDAGVSAERLAALVSGNVCRIFGIEETDADRFVPSDCDSIIASVSGEYLFDPYSGGLKGTPKSSFLEI